jgi:hypothetical protein
MPTECAAALQNFVMVNPHWRGAGWDDVLDVLIDTDNHLELTEPLYEQAEEADVQPLELVCPIAITLLWSHRVNNEEWSDVVTLDEVRAVLERVTSA